MPNLAEMYTDSCKQTHRSLSVGVAQNLYGMSNRLDENKQQQKNCHFHNEELRCYLQKHQQSKVTLK